MWSHSSLYLTLLLLFSVSLTRMQIPWRPCWVPSKDVELSNSFSRVTKNNMRHPSFLHLSINDTYRVSLHNYGSSCHQAPGRPFSGAELGLGCTKLWVPALSLLASRWQLKPESWTLSLLPPFSEPLGEDALVGIWFLASGLLFLLACLEAAIA